MPLAKYKENPYQSELTVELHAYYYQHKICLYHQHKVSLYRIVKSYACHLHTMNIILVPIWTLGELQLLYPFRLISHYKAQHRVVGYTDNLKTTVTLYLLFHTVSFLTQY